MKKLQLLIVLSLIFLFIGANAQKLSSYHYKDASMAEGWRKDSIHHYTHLSSGDSILVLRDIYTINEYGLTTELTRYMQDLSFIWQKYVLQEFSYDIWNRQLERIDYFWNSGEWVPQDRKQTTYHEGDTLIESNVYSYWTGQDWGPNDSISYLRNEANMIDSIAEFTWNNTQNIYLPYHLKRNIYDAGNTLTSDTTFYHQNNSWNATYYRDYYYNGSGNIIEGLEKAWNSNSMSWRNDTRILLTYDGNQNNTMVKIYEWDEDSIKWMNDHMFINSYTSNNLLSMIRYLEWDTISLQYKNEITSQQFWSLHAIIGLEDHGLTQVLKAFPNPASHHVNIFVEEDCDLVMLNISGQQMLSASLSKGINVIMVSDYPPGTYILQTKGDLQTSSLKLLIRR